MRTKFPKGREFSLRPGTPAFTKAFADILALYPDLKLGYVGTKDGVHYFQLHGDPVAYVAE